MDFNLDADPGMARVFAHFGLAVAKAQVVERLLAALVVYPDLVHLQTQGERNEALRRQHRANLSELRKRLHDIGGTDFVDAILKEVGEVRNATVHRYFSEDRHMAMLGSAAGQAELVKQLLAVAARFDEVETHLRDAMRRFGGLEFEFSSDPANAPIPRILLDW